MGFGTLFFGYFLLLNITYFSFTDLIASLIMAMGLYKLSEVNVHFKSAFYVSLSFSAVGLVELVCGFISMFSPTLDLGVLFDYTALVRYVIIAMLTLLILRGIGSVAEEVGLDELAKRARVSMAPTLVIYGAYTILSIPLQTGETITKILSVASVLAMLGTLVIVTVNLITVYRAYMKICMPEDVDNEVEDKPSRFEFINRHRAHTEAKQKEYAEYRLKKFKKKNSKKKKK